MPARKPATPLCDQFGFDADWRDAQLSLAGLESFNRDNVHLLHDKVLDRETRVAVVDRFFERILQHPQVDELLASFDIGHLKQRQVQFLADFGTRFQDVGYFESRARVCMVHARVGLPLSLYLATFSLLQSLLVETILDRIEMPAQRQVLTQLVTRLTSLDIVLATEIFQRAGIEAIKGSLRPARYEQGILRQQLEQDALTSVSSRTSLLRELQAAMQRSGKTGQALVVLQADLDHFKTINDSHGHRVGDKVLIGVATRIQAALRELDLVGRYGGEEFIILLENTSSHTANQVAERIRQCIVMTPVKAGVLDLKITLSQGLTLCREGENSRVLLERVGQAVSKAKQAGGNRIVEV